MTGNAVVAIIEVKNPKANKAVLEVPEGILNRKSNYRSMTTEFKDELDHYELYIERFTYVKDWQKTSSRISNNSKHTNLDPEV